MVILKTMRKELVLTWRMFAMYCDSMIDERDEEGGREGGRGRMLV